MQQKVWRQQIENGKLDERLTALYGGERLQKQKTAYVGLLNEHEEHFGVRDVVFVSAPGRIELLGNHTDHNHGKVLTAAIDRDTVAVVSRADDRRVRLYSRGYAGIQLSLESLDAVEEEAGRTAALIRGVAKAFADAGYRVGGLDAVVMSDVLSGSGMSSSAAFEVLVCAAMDALYNGFTVPAVQKAKMSQYAENVYFFKPSGLMDQLASAHGGLIAVDFAEGGAEVSAAPNILKDKGYGIVVVATGGSHDDLTHEYAAIPQEMKAVAQKLGGQTLRDSDKMTLLMTMPHVRQTCGDRAMQRALHYYEENERVEAAVQCLRQGDVKGFLNAVHASGVSSWTMLQNVFVPGQQDQPVAASQAAANAWLQGQGVSRVHGGGFAGTTLHFVPLDKMTGFCMFMDGIFGEGSAMPVTIRDEGAVLIGDPSAV